jgi:N-acetylglutamate synthase-like GNAT family acetyltransferase
MFLLQFRRYNPVDMQKNSFILQSAEAGHAEAIKQLIHSVGINPMNLAWKRFIVALDADGGLIGCGQIKPHRDGSRELASIAVRESDRGRGVARAIIERLLADNPLPLYLTCRSELESFYQLFGFRALVVNEMPPYFNRLSRFARFLTSMTGGRVRLSVMRWDG